MESTFSSKRGRCSSSGMCDGMADSKPSFPELPSLLLKKKKKAKPGLYEINNFCQLYILIFGPCQQHMGFYQPAEPAFPALEEA